MPEELPGKIRSVQLRLDDFIKGVTTVTEKIDRVFRNTFNDGLKYDFCAGKVLRLEDEDCLKCGSRNLSRNGTNEKTLENGVKIRLQRYYCKFCDDSFTTPVEGYSEHNHYRDKTIDDTAKIRTENTSLRKIREIYELIKDKAPSHETIRQWMGKIRKKFEEEKKITKGSGIYSYDEQYLKIDGKKAYRLAIKDVISEDTVNEKIVDKLTKDNIENFLLDSLKEKRLTALVTDGDPQYDDILKNIARELEIDDGIIPQLCIFHALKGLSKAAAKARKATKNRGLGYPTDHSNLKDTIKLVFNLDDEKKRNKYLERLPEDHKTNFQEIINDERKTLKQEAREIFDFKYVTRTTYHTDVVEKIEWIDEHWDQLTRFYEYEDIPKTNNTVEHHFSSRNPRLIKKAFKTKQSLENHLCATTYFQNENSS